MGHHSYVFLVSLALLLVSATHAAGGHARTQATAAAVITQQGTDDVLVGSSPPNCDGKCGWWCVGSSCKAVLVPIEPPKKQGRRQGSGGGDHGSRASPAAQHQQQRPSAVDGDHSNYKAMTWICKCVG